MVAGTATATTNQPQHPAQPDTDMVASADTAGAAEAVLRSRDADGAARLRAVKGLKNTVIGNRFKKLQHLGAVPLLLELLASHATSSHAPSQPQHVDPAASAELAVQAAAALGSLAYGVEDGVRAIVGAGGVAAILAALSSSEARVVVAAARALKLVYQSPVAPHEPLLAAPTLQRLVALLALQPPQLPVATAAASVLARVCTAPDEAAKLVGAGAVAALVPLLTVSSRACQEAALEALAAASAHSPAARQQLLLFSSPALQRHLAQAAQQQQQSWVAPTLPPKPLPSVGAGADAAAGAVAGSSKQAAARASPSPPPTRPQPEQPQQPCSQVVAQLLQLSRQRDPLLRFLVAACISNLRPEDAGDCAAGGGDVGTQQQLSSSSSTRLEEELLHAGRVSLPHLVRLLPAATAAATSACECLEFITQHTHHPHYPPFARGQPGKSSSGGGGGNATAPGSSAGAAGSYAGGPSSSKATGQAAGGDGAGAAVSGGSSGSGDQGFLLRVPRVLAQLAAGRPELISLAVDLDAVKQLAAILATASPATAALAATVAAAHAHASSHSGGGTSSSGALSGSSSASAAVLAALAASSASGGASNGTGAGAASSNGAAPVPAGTPASSSSAAAAAKAARTAAAGEAAAAAAAGILALRRGVLAALAALAMGSDVARQQIVDGKLVPAVMRALGEADAGVRQEAASVLRGLSRSVRLLRGPSLPPTLAGPLVALLLDSTASGVQAAATAAACNLVLDFSQLRGPLIQAGVLAALCPLVSSMLPELRLHALWALKNLTFGCEPQLQASLLQELSWESFRALLVGDDEPRVRQQAVGLLQNLCKGGDSISQLLQWCSNELLPLLESQLEPARYAPLFSAAQPRGAASSSSSAAGFAPLPAGQHKQLQDSLSGLLYVAANVCSGCEQHKAAVMASTLPSLLLAYLQLGGQQMAAAAAAASAATPGSSGEAAAAHGQAGSVRSLWEVTLPVVWSVINLLWLQEVPVGRGPRRPAAAGGGAAGGGGGDQPGSQPSNEAASAAQEPQPVASAGADAAGGDTAMAAADGEDDGDAAAAAAAAPMDAAQAAVLSRAAALRQLGFGEALTALLGALRTSAGGGDSDADAAGAAAAEGAAAAAAAAAAGAVVEGAVSSQDLVERAQTALEQLSMESRPAVAAAAPEPAAAAEGERHEAAASPPRQAVRQLITCLACRQSAVESWWPGVVLVELVGEA